MSFNVTGFKPYVFATFNSAIHIGVFLTLTVPKLVLNVLCIVALLFAKTNRKIKVTLINIFAAETVFSIGLSVKYIGYPIRVSNVDASGISCDIRLGFLFTGYLTNATAITLYAITVYLFIKYGWKKVKMCVIALAIAVSWTVFSVIGIIMASPAVIVSFNSNGFCVIEGGGELSLSSVFPAIAALALLVSACLVTTFGVLTCSVRRQVAECSTDTKKAITKILFYHAIKMLVLSVEFGGGVLLTVLRPPPSSHSDVVAFLAINYAIVDVLNDVAFLMTPIVSLIIFKPLREALMMLCPCCGQRPNVALPASHAYVMTVVTSTPPSPLLVSEETMNAAPPPPVVAEKAMSAATPPPVAAKETTNAAPPPPVVAKETTNAAPPSLVVAEQAMSAATPPPGDHECRSTSCSGCQKCRPTSSSSGQGDHKFHSTSFGGGRGGLKCCPTSPSGCQGDREYHSPSSAGGLKSCPPLKSQQVSWNEK